MAEKVAKIGVKREPGFLYFLRGSDELHYEEVGLAFAQTLDLFDYIGIRGNLVPVWHNSVGYIYVVGVLDKFALLFGEAHTMVPRLFNAAMLGLTDGSAGQQLKRRIV